MNERAFTVLESCSLWTNEAGLGDEDELETGGAIKTTGEIILYLTDFCGNTPEDISGEWSDLGGSTFEEFCPCQGFIGDCLCPGDINFDGSVDGADLALLLGAWGKCPDCIGLEDLTLDGIVDGADLAILLGAWGDCRSP